MAGYHFNDPTLVHVETPCAITHKDKRFIGAQTAQAVWTPTTGKALRITSITAITSAAATMTIFVNTDAEGNRLVDGPFAANGGIDKTFTPYYPLDVDEALKITTTTGNASVVVFGYEV